MIDSPSIDALTPEDEAELRARLLGMRSGTDSQREARALLTAHGLRAIVDGPPRLDARTFALLCRAGCSPHDTMPGVIS